MSQGLLGRSNDFIYFIFLESFENDDPVIEGIHFNLYSGNDLYVDKSVYGIKIGSAQIIDFPNDSVNGYFSGLESLEFWNDSNNGSTLVGNNVSNLNFMFADTDFNSNISQLDITDNEEVLVAIIQSFAF